MSNINNNRKPVRSSGLLSSENTINHKIVGKVDKKNRRRSSIPNLGKGNLAIRKGSRKKPSLKETQAVGIGNTSTEDLDYHKTIPSPVQEENEEEAGLANDVDYHPVLNPSAFKFNNYLKTNVDISVSDIGSHPYNDAHAHYDYNMYTESNDVLDKYEIAENGQVVYTGDEDYIDTGKPEIEKKAPDAQLEQELKKTEEGFMTYNMNEMMAATNHELSTEQSDQNINSSSDILQIESSQVPSSQALNKSFISETEPEQLTREEDISKLDLFYEPKHTFSDHPSAGIKQKRAPSILSGVHKIHSSNYSTFQDDININKSLGIQQSAPQTLKKRRMSLVDYIKNIGDIKEGETEMEKTAKYEASAVLSDYDLKARKHAKDLMKTDSKFSSIPENTTQYFIVFEELAKEELKRLKKTYGPPKRFFDGRTKLPLELIYGSTIARGYGSRLQTGPIFEAHRHFSLLTPGDYSYIDKAGAQKRVVRRSSLALGFIEKGVSLATQKDIRQASESRRREGVINYNPHTDEIDNGVIGTISPQGGYSSSTSSIESISPEDDLLKDTEYSDIAKAAAPESSQLLDSEPNNPQQNIAIKRHSSLRSIHLSNINESSDDDNVSLTNSEPQNNKKRP